MALTKEQKMKLVRSFQLHEKDTGSPEVQIAILTERVNQLTEHLKVHKVENSSMNTTRFASRSIDGASEQPKIVVSTNTPTEKNRRLSIY